MGWLGSRLWVCCEQAGNQIFILWIKRLCCSTTVHRELNLQRRSICRPGESHKSLQHRGTSISRVFISFFLMACSVIELSYIICGEGRMTQWLIKLSAITLDFEKYRRQEKSSPQRRPDKLSSSLRQSESWGDQQEEKKKKKKLIPFLGPYIFSRLWLNHSLTGSLPCCHVDACSLSFKVG